MQAPLLSALSLAVVLYPLIIVLLWCALALLWSWRREWPERWLQEAPGVETQPAVSVLIPCFNEGPNLAETLRAALSLQWEDFEVIAINDGSSDDTGRQLEAWSAREPRLRVVHLARNQGKALALHAGALLARHELLLCIDGDALLDPQAVGWLVRHFQHDPRLGAVTGNPRIRNRSTLLGRLQVGEFSMIIGLIKRAQSQLGGLFCVSGVIGCFRRSALHEVGYWDPSRLTEDIDITWRLQRAGGMVAPGLLWLDRQRSLEARLTTSKAAASLAGALHWREAGLGSAPGSARGAPGEAGPGAAGLERAALASELGLPEAQLFRARHAALCTVHHDEQGRIVALELPTPALPLPSPDAHPVG